MRRVPVGEDKDPRLAVVALGGNALLRRGQRGTFEEQYAAASGAATGIADLVEAGYRIVVTHGNGPQVGAQQLRHDAGERIHGLPALPLHACDAETQGLLGYIVQQALSNELRSRGIDARVAALVTRTRVDPSDPAFANPTKPVGPFYSEEDARRIAAGRPGVALAEEPGRGWRVVVPSPDPVEVLERGAVRALVDSEFIVVACGGGGIPVVEEGGILRGVDAVVDKDLASEVLATAIGAGTLAILTDVDGAYLNYGKPGQRMLGRVGVEELEGYYAEGHFGSGSMGPKVLAAIRFIRNGGLSAVIGPLERTADVVLGRAGTLVVP
jgi:carbamate kinase